jgi:hypothetical protein
MIAVRLAKSMSPWRVLSTPDVFVAGASGAKLFSVEFRSIGVGLSRGMGMAARQINCKDKIAARQNLHPMAQSYFAALLNKNAA